MKVFVQLKMLSDELTFEEMVKSVDISFDSIWRKGSLRKGAKIKERFNGCSVGSKLASDCEIIQHIEVLLSDLDFAAEKFKAISASVEVLLSCAIYSDSPTALYFDKKLIKRIADFGASLDVDLYLLPE